MFNARVFVHVSTSGESFDRQASVRRVVSNTDSLSRRPRNLSRRKTVAGIPDDVGRKLGTSCTCSFPLSSINQSINHFTSHVCPCRTRSITQFNHLSSLSRLAFGVFSSPRSVLHCGSTRLLLLHLCPTTEEYRGGGGREGERRS